MADATFREIMAYFGMSTAEFRREWKELTEQDKAELKRGLGDKTLTY